MTAAGQMEVTCPRSDAGDLGRPGSRVQLTKSLAVVFPSQTAFGATEPRAPRQGVPGLWVTDSLNDCCNDDFPPHPQCILRSASSEEPWPVPGMVLEARARLYCGFTSMLPEWPVPLSPSQKACVHFQFPSIPKTIRSPVVNIFIHYFTACLLSRKSVPPTWPVWLSG